MNQKLITLTVASAFGITSGIALAEGPNDPFKYPNAESHKNYTDQRIMDQNNAAPRYSAVAPVKNQNVQHIQDSNNAAPRYPSTTKQAASQDAEGRSPQHMVRSTQRRVISGNPS